MSEDAVLLSVERGVATVTFNRPERLNALDPLTSERLDALFVQLACDQDVRAVVLTGAGRGFCSGADLMQTNAAARGTKLQPAPGHPHPQYDRISRAPLELRYRYVATAALPQPVIAAVNGPCAGVGFSLAVSSDVRFASVDAVFVASFARRGLTAEAGLAWSLPRLIGLGPATDILLSGRKVGAQEALRLGLVSEVTDSGAVLQRALDYAHDLAENVSPRSARIIKRQLQQAAHQSHADALSASYLEVLLSMDSQDAKEGGRAFTERRPARFTGQ